MLKDHFIQNLQIRKTQYESKCHLFKHKIDKVCLLYYLEKSIKYIYSKQDCACITCPFKLFHESEAFVKHVYPLLKKSTFLILVGPVYV